MSDLETDRTTERLEAEAPTFSMESRALGARLEPGELVLDRYRLHERLGAGGFGVVWLAVDERLEREVALKAVSREGLGGMARTEREARAAARLGHPGVVALYELGADAERVYLVSEYVPGRSLAELIEGGAISDRDVARVGEAMCDALAHAHARGVVHRDVKPQNIMVVAEPAAGAGFAKLADFGASRLASEDALTRTGDVVGTLAYMAPEQAEGHESAGEADLYGLAITLYEALAGHNPVRGRNLADTARRLGGLLPELERYRPDLPLGLTRAVDRGLDPEPARRGSLADLRAGLAGTGEELSAAGGLEEPETLERFGLAPRRRRRWPDLRPAPAPARAPDLADDLDPEPRGRRLVARLAAGLAAGVLVGLATESLASGRPPVEPAAVAAVVGLAVGLFPRIAWLLTAATLAGWLALGGLDREGLAVLVAVAAACVPILLPRAGTLWSAPAGAVALGAVALGPAFCALAGLARGTVRRAALGAVGYLWVALAELASGRRLVFGVPEDAGSAAAIVDSPISAVTAGLAPLVTTPALLPAVLWAAAAALLPLAVRGRVLGMDLMLGAVWSAGVVLAHLALGEHLVQWGLASDPRGALGGVVLGALAAVAAASVWPRMPRG